MSPGSLPVALVALLFSVPHLRHRAPTRARRSSPATRGAIRPAIAARVVMTRVLLRRWIGRKPARSAARNRAVDAYRTGTTSGVCRTSVEGERRSARRRGPRVSLEDRAGKRRAWEPGRGCTRPLERPHVLHDLGEGIGSARLGAHLGGGFETLAAEIGRGRGSDARQAERGHEDGQHGRDVAPLGANSCVLDRCHRSAGLRAHPSRFRVQVNIMSSACGMCGWPAPVCRDRSA